jgi:hypothetical protein
VSSAKDAFFSLHLEAVFPLELVPVKPPAVSQPLTFLEFFALLRVTFLILCEERLLHVKERYCEILWQPLENRTVVSCNATENDILKVQ